MWVLSLIASAGSAFALGLPHENGFVKALNAGAAVFNFGMFLHFEIDRLRGGE